MNTSGVFDSGGPYITSSAWVSFQGTSTVAIRSDYNVSSVGDGGVGTYTVYIDVDMPDTNYVVAAGGSDIYNGCVMEIHYPTAPATTDFDLGCRQNKGSAGSNGKADPAYVMATVHGN
jgi:hypothetical protein